MSKISLLIPTRQRPDLLKHLFDSIEKQTACPRSIEVILYVDLDDKSYDKLPRRSFEIIKLSRPRANMGICNTECFRASSGNIIILLNDDVVLRTKNWDKLLLAELAKIDDEVFLAYPNDLFKKSKLATFPILSRKTCELLEDPFPPVYKGAFIDAHLVDVFQRLKHQGHDRILYLNNIVFEHMHYRLKKSNFDKTYQERDRFGDDFAFAGLAQQRKIQAQRLLSAIKGTKLSPLTMTYSLPSITPPKNFITAIGLFLRTFLLDSDLSLTRRTYLFYYHSARYFAQKVMRKIRRN